MQVRSLTGAILALVIALQGCSSDKDQSAPDDAPGLVTMSGTVDFQNVGPIKRGDSLVIELLDVTEGIEGAPVLASSQTGHRTSSPYLFTLSYDPRLIREERDYRVRAEMRRDGETVVAGNNTVDPFSVDQVFLNFAPPAIEPVAIGRTISLQGFRWYIEEIGGDPVDVVLESRPYMEVDGSEDSFHGFAGCNTFTGRYTLNGTTLEFGTVATTRRTCESGMQTEQEFLALLEKVGSWRLDDGKMVLGNADREVLARFVLLSDEPLENP